MLANFEEGTPIHLKFDFDRAKDLIEWVVFKEGKIQLISREESVYRDQVFGGNCDYIKQFLTEEELDYLKRNPITLEDYYFNTLEQFLVKNQHACLKTFKNL